MMNNAKGSRVVRRGFTLIELLVVVSIIALLVSILLPAMGRARKQAHKVVCVTNLRQIGLGCAMYANDDRKGYYPSHAAIGGSSFRVYPGEIAPGSDKEEIYGLPAVLGEGGYIDLSAQEVWMCPANKKDAEYLNTYWVYNSDSITQNPDTYDPTDGERNTSQIWYVCDNWNLMPYISGVARTDMSPDGQGRNDPAWWRDPTYWHRGRSDRHAMTTDIDRGYTWGVNLLHYDQSIGFLALATEPTPQ